MATDDRDMDNSKRGWYMSPTGRGRGLLAGRGRGLGPPSPSHVGSGLRVLQLGRGRSLRPPSLLIQEAELWQELYCSNGQRIIVV